MTLLHGIGPALAGHLAAAGLSDIEALALNGDQGQVVSGLSPQRLLVLTAQAGQLVKTFPEDITREGPPGRPVAP